MPAMASPWGKPGAWALDSEEHEAELLKEEQEQQQQQQKKAELSLDFPSLNDALATKQKKKGQTLSLAEFTAHAGSGSKYSSQGRTHEDVLVLPTGPRERTAEELDRNKLGGGFRNYGSNGSYERSNRYSNGDDSSNSKWGSSRVSDENRRNDGGFNRGDSSKEFVPSRADEVDNWASTKKPMAGNGFERRDRGLGFSDSQSSKADESESWVSNKSNVPSDARRFGANGGFERERRGGFPASGGGADSDTWGRKKDEGNISGGGGGGADSDTWGRKKDEGNSGGGGGGSRPKLNLQPRTLPVNDVKSSEISGTTARSKSLNPFGEARPREEVLAEKGHDWKKLDEELELKIKEVSMEKTEKSNPIGKKSFGNGTAPPFPRPLFPRLASPVKTKSIDVAAQDPRPYSPSLSLLSIPHIANSPPTHYCQLIPPDWTASRFQHSHYHYHQFILFDVQRTVGSPQSLCIHTGYFTTHCDVFTVTTAYSYPTLSTPAASQSARGI